MTLSDRTLTSWRQAGKHLCCLAALLTLCILPARAADPVIGAWRSVRNESDKQQFWFAMLPQTVPAGTTFIAVDWKGGKLVCCLTVRGKEISENTLRNKLHIPGPWVTDLVNGWNTEHPPYRPHVLALTPSGDFLTHQFAGIASFSVGGLLLPDNAHLDARGRLMIGEENYGGKLKEEALGDGDGAVDTYTLKATSGARSFVVEVPYGNH